MATGTAAARLIENRIRVVFEAATDGVTRGIRLMTNDMQRLESASESAADSLDLNEANDGLEGANNHAQNLANTLKTIAKIYIAGKLFQLGKNMVGEYIGYEKGVREIFTLLDQEGAKAFDNLNLRLLQFSKKIGALPTEIAPAMYQAISSSVSQEDLYPFLETAQKSAVGGVTDMFTSVDVLTSIVNNYTKEVLSYERASDIMFTTALRGKTNFKELASYMYNIAPSAQAVGVSFEQMSGSLATMTKVGIPTAQATTQLRTMFDELSKSGTRSSDIFRNISGNGFMDYMKHGGEVTEVMRMMRNYADKHNLSMKDLFNSTEAGAAALALSGKNLKTFQADVEAMRNSTGATEKAFRKMDESIGRSVEKVKTRFQYFVLATVQKASPEVKAAVDELINKFDDLEESGAIDNAMVGIAKSLSALAEGFVDFASNADQWGIAFGGTLRFIGQHMKEIVGAIKLAAKAWLLFKTVAFAANLVNSLATLAQLITQIGEGILWVFTTVRSLAAGIGGLAGVWETLSAVLISTPFGWIIGLVVALGIAFVVLAKKVGGFKNAFKVTISFVGNLVLKFYEFMFTFWRNIIKGIGSIVQHIPLIGKAMKKVIDSVVRMMDFLIKKIKSGISWLKELGRVRDKDNKGKESKNKKPKNPKPKNPKSKNPKLEKLEMPEEQMKENYNFDIDEAKIKRNVQQKKKITIDDLISNVDDKYKDKVDLYESRSDLAKASENTAEAKKNKQQMVSVLRIEADELLNLQQGKNEKDRNIVEVARNKILTKIADLTKDIKDGVDNMSGEFNKPAEIDTLTKYQNSLSTTNNTLSKRMIFAPNVQMILKLDNLDDKNAQKIRGQVEHFANNVWGKDMTVGLGMADVTRN